LAVKTGYNNSTNVSGLGKILFCVFMTKQQFQIKKSFHIGQVLSELVIFCYTTLSDYGKFCHFLEFSAVNFWRILENSAFFGTFLENSASNPVEFWKILPLSGVFCPGDVPKCR